MVFHSCDGFDFLFWFGLVFLRREVPIYAAPPEHRQKALPKLGFWLDVVGSFVCSFVFWARAEGPGMKNNGNTFTAFQTES